MALVIPDLRKPPLWLVHVTMVLKHGPWPAGQEATWPFRTRREAENAYRMAVQSGHFGPVTFRKATKKLPAVELTLVSMWRRQYVRSPRDGRRLLEYLCVAGASGEGEDPAAVAS